MAEAAADTFLGHWFNQVFRSWPNRLLSRMLDRPGRWFCSELVAFALSRQPEFEGRGVLRFPPDIIDPQELFEDVELFEEAETAGDPTPAKQL